MLNLTRSFFSFLLLSSFFILSTEATAQNIPTNIAVVNFEQVLATSSAPKSIREQVQKKRDAYRKEIQIEESELRKSNQDLAQKQTLLSKESYKEERRKFEQKVLSVQKKVQEKNVYLQKAQTKAQQKVKDALRKVVLKIAQKNGYPLVLRHSQTVVVADKMNITKLVISELNKQLPTINVFGK